MSHIFVPRRDELAVIDDKLSLRYQQYLEELGNSTNDNSTQVDANTVNIATNTTNIATNTTSIAGINTELGVLVVASTNYTTVSTSRVICNAAITITLRASPGDDEKVYVKRTNGEVTVNGNGNNIDGEASVILNAEYTTVLFVFSSFLDAWYIM